MLIIFNLSFPICVFVICAYICVYTYLYITMLLVLLFNHLTTINANIFLEHFRRRPSCCSLINYIKYINCVCSFLLSFNKFTCAFNWKKRNKKYICQFIKITASLIPLCLGHLDHVYCKIL